MKDRTHQRTLFQTHGYARDVDLRTDAVIVYGWRTGLDAEVRTWREQGYHVHFMTGAAWGGYSHYVNGDFDGKSHIHEAQVAATGERIDHGNEIFYFVPTSDYAGYLEHVVERAVDAGVEAIHLEEPEFWVRGGYSDAFKREWQAHYGRPWAAPHESASNWYAAAQLKYELYTSLLKRVFAHAKEYVARTRPEIPLECYVASHSLINYAQWGIVSPESNLAHLDSCDGYVCQVWTGTARTPNRYRGLRSERTFETAYLEYAQMMAMILSTSRRIWFLADPIEDDPDHDWNDYRMNYQATLVASLLNHQVSSFEVMPWPQRVFRSVHEQPGDGAELSRIPPDYATELLTLSNALSEIGAYEVTDPDGLHRVAVAVSDTILFERGWGEAPRDRLRGEDDRRPPDLIYRIGPGADPEMDGFYGLALPLVKRGVPLRIVHLEHVGLAGYLDELDVIVLSYDFMKPASPSVHQAIGEWIHNGGVLVYAGDASPGDFDRISAWWETGPVSFMKPVHHLLQALGLDASCDAGFYPVGAGAVLMTTVPAADLARAPDAADTYATQVTEAYGRSRMRDGAWRETDTLSVERGPYLAIARLSESAPNAGETDVILTGPFLDLFASALPVRESVSLQPGDQTLLYKLGHAGDGDIVAVAGRVEGGTGAGDDPFVVTTPSGIAGQLVIAAARAPVAVTVGQPNHGDRADASWTYDSEHGLIRIHYDGSPDGVHISLSYDQT